MTRAPLAERMRPKQLDEVVGQDHLVGEQATLRRAVQTGNLPSMILWGPPGVGKTTLARLLAEASGRPFHALSAIHSGVKDVRQVLDSARRDGMFAGRAVLFLDEIHRFSKSQQDSLLGAVEAGTVTLIGATTENPSFEVIPALRSRCQVYVLEPLTAEALQTLALRALREDEVMSNIGADVVEWEALLRASGGDARRMLNILESIVLSLPQSGDVVVNNAAVEAQIQQHISSYDKSGEQHYDIISAFIKSIRASDPNAAVYYLARMVEGGEDPTFIARRLLILASEDIGNANPTGIGKQARPVGVGIGKAVGIGKGKQASSIRAAMGGKQVTQRQFYGGKRPRGDDGRADAKRSRVAAEEVEANPRFRADKPGSDEDDD